MKNAVEEEERHYQRMEAGKKKLNPCPLRTDAERKYVSRRLEEIKDVLQYHIFKTLPVEPKWLPDFTLTGTHDEHAADSLEGFQTAERGDAGYVLGMHDGSLRASNRVRVAAWYKNPDNDLYMTTLPIVSPLPCDDWGALPLTRTHWKIVLPIMIVSHMHWKWIHAVRSYLADSSFEVGKSFGWHLESNVKLKQDDSVLCTGQAIYSHIVRKYSDHALKG